MKYATRLFTLLAGLCAAFSFSALAQEGDKDGERRGPRGPRGGPGAGRELTGEEKAKFAERRKKMEALRKEHDKDGDGRLDEDERKAYTEAVMVVRLDEDGDGKLNDEEKAKAEEARKRFRGRGRGGDGQGRRGRRGGGDAEGRRGPRGGRPGGRQAQDAKDKDGADKE